MASALFLAAYPVPIMPTLRGETESVIIYQKGLFTFL
jgi:hypothetical protein